MYPPNIKRIDASVIITYEVLPSPHTHTFINTQFYTGFDIIDADIGEQQSDLARLCADLDWCDSDMQGFAMKYELLISYIVQDDSFRIWLQLCPSDR